MNKKRLSENDIRSMVMENIASIKNDVIRKIVRDKLKKSLSEGVNNDTDDYTHYAVSKSSNKIVNAWNYEGIEGSELRQFKKDYFMTDLIDNEIDPKDIKILSKRALLKQGIDPDDDSNWADSVAEGKSRNGGRAINEVSKDVAQRAYNKLNRLGQYGDHGPRLDSYKGRAGDLYYNYADTHDDELEDTPTPEEYFHYVCEYVEKDHGVQLESGWYVEALCLDEDEIYFYESAEDAKDENRQPDYTFTSNEEQHPDMENPQYDGDYSIVEDLYNIGKHVGFNYVKTLDTFARQMLG